MQDTAQEKETLRDAERYRWLKEALQRAYDGEPVEISEITVYCKMILGRGSYRRLEANIYFSDERDEDVNLDAAIDAAIKGEVAPSTDV